MLIIQLYVQRNASDSEVGMRKEVEISVLEAAKRLGVVPSYAYLLARTGRLKGRKDGRYWLISEQSVRERKARIEASRQRTGNTDGDLWL